MKDFSIPFKIAFIVFFFALTACKTAPQPIKMGDPCSTCKMGVADNRFGAEIITNKGKIFKFDDMHCVLEFLESKKVPNDQVKNILFVNYETPHDFINADESFLLKSADLRSPMGSNIAAFKSLTNLKNSQKSLRGEEIKWSSLAKN